MSRKLLKSTATVSSLTMVSRILGFIRDMVFARVFGAGVGTDAFFVAFKIPNFLRRLFAEGAFSLAFVPVLSEYKEQRGHTEVHELINRVAGTLGGILFLVSLAGVLAAPLLIMLFAPGFIGDAQGRYELAVEMLRFTFPYLLFISLTAFAGGILNSYGRFGIPALTPVLLNLCLIGAALWLAPLLKQPIIALAWAVFAAGALQLAFQLPFLWRLKLLPRPRWGWAYEGVQRILKLMLPAIFGSSVAQINLLLDTLIASFLAAGSVSWLYYSDRLMEFPLGVFGIALATVILPSLSRRHAAESGREFSRILDWGLRWVLVVGAPAMLGLMLLSGPILATLFQYGEFGTDDVLMARRSLMAYSLGLLGFMLIKVLAPGFYARQDTRTPVRFGVIAMICNMALNLLLVWPLAHAGLALATSLGAFINAALLFHRLRRDEIYTPGGGWPLLLLRVLLASTAMGLVLHFGTASIDQWLDWSALDRVLQLLLWIAVGTAAYASVLLISGLRPRHMQDPA
jgi:putative peptidoglycan lipid II flippase